MADNTVKAAYWIFLLFNRFLSCYTTIVEATSFLCDSCSHLQVQTVPSSTWDAPCPVVTPSRWGLARRFLLVHYTTSFWFLHYKRLRSIPPTKIRKTMHRKSPNPLGSLIFIQYSYHILASISRFIFSAFKFFVSRKITVFSSFIAEKTPDGLPYPFSTMQIYPFSNEPGTTTHDWRFHMEFPVLQRCEM